jgi:hypothetical protein
VDPGQGLGSPELVRNCPLGRQSQIRLPIELELESRYHVMTFCAQEECAADESAPR